MVQGAHSAQLLKCTVMHGATRARARHIGLLGHFLLTEIILETIKDLLLLLL